MIDLNKFVRVVRLFDDKEYNIASEDALPFIYDNEGNVRSEEMKAFDASILWYLTAKEFSEMNNVSIRGYIPEHFYR